MSETPLRDVFGKALAELGHLNHNVVALDADLAGATKSIHFGKAHPNRFFNVGIAEANMVSIAAGLSTCGKIPYACTFAFLITLRALDQIRSQVCYPHLNVKLVGTNGGLSGFGDGATHQEVADLAIMRAMPGMTVVAPSDEVTMRQAVLQSADHVGPFYLRVPRVPAPVLHSEDSPFTFGKGIVLREGADVTIVAMGMMVCRAMDAAEKLSGAGIRAEVIEIHTLKPIDAELLAASASKTGAVVTAEEHTRYGGLFSAVAEVVGELKPVPLGHVAIEDRFGESGQYDEIMEACGLTVDHIAAEAKTAVARKRV
jgi:transketolase